MSPSSGKPNGDAGRAQLFFPSPPVLWALWSTGAWKALGAELKNLRKLSRTEKWRERFSGAFLSSRSLIGSSKCPAPLRQQEGPEGGRGKVMRVPRFRDLTMVMLMHGTGGEGLQPPSAEGEEAWP
ncbi:hypothetical protein [Arthrobacter yangruifuii]|uniref:hypothetical protein n=1 Tax=Arthrobacter yangruifuii TaxID=2606616 RepID=UPI0018858C7E|nr:hypothetical protein [Arthrobacter yangruifuii]